MSVRFDATSDQIERTTAPAIGTSGWTFTAWVYLSVDRNDYSTIMRMSASGSTRANVATDSNGQTLAHFTIGGSLTSATTMTAGGWYRVAVSIASSGGTSSTGVLYTAAATGPVSSTSGTVSSNNDADHIAIGGRGAGDSSEWFNGRVAHARMWTAALSQAEIEAEWGSATPVRTSALWADWPLTSASDLTDHSGSSRALTAGSTAVTTEGDPPTGIYTGFGPIAPAVTYPADTTAYTLSTAFKVTRSGLSLTKIRLYLSSNGGAVSAANVLSNGDLEYTIYGQTDGLYSGSGAMPPGLITTQTVGSLTMDAWNEFTLPTPLALTAGSVYYASVWMPAGRYSAISASFGADVVVGPITFPEDGVGVPGLGITRNGGYTTTPGGVSPVNQSFNDTWYGIDVEVSDATGSDSTITPAAVASTATVPAPTPSANVTITPAAVAVAAAVPAPVLPRDAVIGPAGVAAVAAVPAPTVTAGSTVAPAAVTAVAATPARTVTAGCTVAPAAVAALTATPARTVTTVSAITPAAVAALTSTPARTLATGSTASPAAVAALTATPARTVEAGSSVSPTAIAAATVTPAGALAVGSRLTPAVVQSAAFLPAATVVTPDVRVAPAVVAGLTVIPAGQVASSAGLSPAAVPAAASVPGVAVSAGVVLAPGSVAGAVFLPAVTVVGDAAVRPAVVVVRVVMPSFLVGADAPVAVQKGSWETWFAIQAEAAWLAREDAAAPVTVCPNDGEPLLLGPRGEMYCPYDGFRPR